MKRCMLICLAFSVLVVPAVGDVSVITVGGANPGMPDNQDDLFFSGYTGAPSGNCAAFTGVVLGTTTISCDQPGPAAMAAAIAAGLNTNLPAGWTVVNAGATITVTSPPGTDFTCRGGSTEEATVCEFGYDVPPDLNNLCAGGAVADGRAAHAAGWNFRKTDIPTVSEWGMAVMVLLVMAVGTVAVMRYRAVQAQA